MSDTSLSIPEPVTLSGGEISKHTARTAAWKIAVPLAATLFLTMLPVTMLVPVLKELVADRFNASSFWTHSFMSINMIGAVLAAPLGGALADRLDKRKPILVMALMIDAALLWAMLQVTTLPVLLIIRFVEGAAHIVAISTLMAIAGDWAGRSGRGRMMGLIGSALIFGTACGAPLGGRIGEHAPEMVFQLGAAFSLAAAILAALTVRDVRRREQPSRFRAAFALLSKRRELLVPYAYAFIDRFCVGVIVSTFILYLGQCQGMSPAERGGLLALFLFPFALLCYPVGRLTDRFGRAMPMCIGSLLFGVVYALYGVLPAGWLPVAMVCSGVLSAIMFAPNLAMCADLAPAEQQATAYAGFNMAGSLGFICGPLVGGTICALLIDSLGPLSTYRIAFLIAGLTEVLCALLTLPYLLALRKRGQTT